MLVDAFHLKDLDTYVTGILIQNKKKLDFKNFTEESFDPLPTKIDFTLLRKCPKPSEEFTKGVVF